jgi:hypothetical protein
MLDVESNNVGTVERNGARELFASRSILREEAAGVLNDSLYTGLWRKENCPTSVNFLMVWDGVGSFFFHVQRCPAFF